jgi:hypothetical protein
VACLRDTFEKTWSWLGDENFDAGALRHIEARAPSSWTLADYGADFDRTLNDLYPDDPEVAEIAWLDWTLRRAFDGPDSEAIDPQVLAQIDWDTAVLSFAPTLVLRDVVTNSAGIWGALADGETPPAAQLLPGPGAVRVWRSGLSPRYRTIQGLERHALAAAMAGSSFAEVCNLLAGEDDVGQAAEIMGSLLQTWLLDGLVCGVTDSVRPGGPVSGPAS